MNEKSIDTDCIMDEDYFGREIGTHSFIHLNQLAFYNECLSSHTNETDSTGKRLYAGAHVAIRSFLKLKDLFQSQSVIEIGCGTGVVGCILGKYCQITNLILTDGNEETLNITRQNLQHFYPEDSYETNQKKAMVLYWEKLMNPIESPSSTIISILQQSNSGKPFDIVIGCELMYYTTDISTMMSTVLALTEGNGLFFHVHLFRRNSLATELIEYLQQYDWITYEANIINIVEEQELIDHCEWYRVRILLSGPRCKMENYVSTDHTASTNTTSTSTSTSTTSTTNIEWKIFQEESMEFSMNNSIMIEEDYEESLSTLFR
jgi:hypothetical protein